VGVDASRIARLANRLEDAGLLERMDAIYPNPHRLTAAGVQIAGGSPVRRWPSAAAVMHYCRRLEAVQHIARDYAAASVRPAGRHWLYTLGLRPSIAEHGIFVGDVLVLLLVDDYHMTAARVLRSWTRRHTPHRLYFSADALRRQGTPLRPTWAAHAAQVYVATTSPDQVHAHRQVAANNEIPATVLEIPTIWHVAA
jgi:hypothetical protein